ncbi:hypothetical protein COV06_02030 [Candidatus Uhrbacteria bacterium CG10_big_fil_rev_8_21_14_0_10_50_16]|uniref:Uncharacterized protein n=1 Tax=Candidatus Uhrbacteria bacterium CG10_big_fil_rev_8_21_14_0_10_50_16 TaxID=1975039 RepID=A0A2H0RMQ5_9BACT|nr:MAG: hypothetical protein COV06_02030 [Candidatus Uhrbacteria bacterium CG10_big_fil_rev_8_21_14_0_10_50_16]
MESFTPPTSASHGAPWYLVIILIVLALSATGAAIWFGVHQSDSSDVVVTSSNPRSEESDATNEVASDIVEEGSTESDSTLPGLGELSATGLDITYDVDAQTGQGYKTAMQKLVAGMFEQARTCETSSVSSYGLPFTIADVAQNNYVPRINDAVFTQKIVKTANNLNGNQIQLCKFGTEVYAFVKNGEGYGHPMMWNGNIFIRYQPLSGVMEDGYFLGDFLPHQTVVGTSRGDMRNVWWSYYILDSATQATDMVETCVDSPATDTSGNEIIGKRHMSCERVWNQ